MKYHDLKAKEKLKNFDKKLNQYKYNSQISEKKSFPNFCIYDSSLEFISFPKFSNKDYLECFFNDRLDFRL